MTNVSLSLGVVKDLVSQGLRHFVVCAGARNAPIIEALKSVKNKNIQVEEYFEERAAAFYAMGISKAGGNPVAVITTSGTAVAELYPAVMESFYSGLPLVVISADRPASYRGSGAPQSVEQPGLFGMHVAKSYDLSVEKTEAVQLFSDSPVHINICFDEPLLDEALEPVELEIKATQLPSSFKAEQFSSPKGSESFRRPLVILGQIEAGQKEFVKSCLLKLDCTVLAEAHSGLREDKDLKPRIVQTEDFENLFDSVIRVGSVPCTRLWRDLESRLSHIPVASFSKLPFSGLSRSGQVAQFTELPDFLNSLEILENTFDDTSHRDQLELARKKYPASEVSMLAAWSKSVSSKSNVLLGNSLPIREWEMAKSFDSESPVIFTNRGVNGIDGLIATACGVAKATNKETHVVLGDLSAMYDLSSLALVARVKPLVKIVVINNGGGMIFRRMFDDAKFENRHDLNFAKSGEMFGLEYGSDILEIRPDSSETDNFWMTYQGTSK